MAHVENLYNIPCLSYIIKNHLNLSYNSDISFHSSSHAIPSGYQYSSACSQLFLRCITVIVYEVTKQFIVFVLYLEVIECSR